MTHYTRTGFPLRVIPTPHDMRIAELLAGFRMAVERNKEQPRKPPPIEADE